MKLNSPNWEALRNELELVKGRFLDGLDRGQVLDVAFIGNSSDVYDWIPSPIIDLDVCLFVSDRSPRNGAWLFEMRQQLALEMEAKGIDFDLRIIRGPYKQAPLEIQRPSLVAHISLFTEEIYLTRPILLRWAWRKYHCTADPLRLARLGPRMPTEDELLNGRGGALQKLRSVESGTAPFVELTLPDLTEIEWTVSKGEPLFAEYCLAAALISARNHARVLGKTEPDSLANRDFVLWYDRTVLNSPGLCQLMRLKEKVRLAGYTDALYEAPELARTYLTNLRDSILHHRTGV